VSEPEADLRDYDPALAETVREGKGDDEVSVIARVTDVAALPQGVRVVTHFGDVVTLRARRSKIAELAQSKAVLAMEASQQLRPTWSDGQQIGDTAGPNDGDGCFVPETAEDDAYTRRPAGVTATGRGVVVGVLDWGCDFAHPAFRHKDGSTRLLALWDQRESAGTSPGNRWGYGRILTAAEIDRALGEPDPYAALAYDPADSDPPDASGGGGMGSHGTHVLDIAAGNGRGGGAMGVAPEADLVFCHLSSTVDVLSRGTLGDAVNLLEALDWVFETAGDRPCVVNLSLGAHGGPHDGRTLVEEGIDKAVWLKSGRVAVNSAGNYFAAGAHTQGRLHQGGEAALRFSVPSGDPTENEIELWYSGADRFTVTVSGPDGVDLATVGPGADAPMTMDGRVVGHVYHVRQATNQEHQVDLFLRPRAPGGTWTIHLRGEAVEDGRYHAWIERDRGPHPTFDHSVAVGTSTTGTLCNGRLSIAVGAYDPHSGERPIGSFSSAGPTRDGRAKPEIVGPGVDICAARSTPAGAAPGARYISKSGTSMAAPHVTGTIALMCEAARRPLEIDEIRALLFSSAQRATFPDGGQVAVDLHRFGYGYLDILAAEAAAHDWAMTEATEASPELALAEVVAAASAGAAPATEEEAVDDELTEAEPMNEALDGSSFAWPDDEPLPAEPSPPASFRRALWGLAESAPAWPRPHELVSLATSALGLESDPRLFVLAHPATRLAEDVRPGDLLVRSAPAQGLHYTSVVVSEPVERGDLAVRRVPVEAGGAGMYVEVAEAPLERGALRSVGRRLTDAWGRVPRGQTLFRAAEAASFVEAAEDTQQAGTPAPALQHVEQYETRGIPIDPAFVRQQASLSYWELQLRAIGFIPSMDTSTHVHLLMDGEELNAVLSAVFQMRPQAATLTQDAMRLITIPARAGAPSSRDVTYQIAFEARPRPEQTDRAVTILFIAAGNVVAAEAAPQGYTPKHGPYQTIGFPPGGADQYWQAHPDEYHRVFNWIVRSPARQFDQLITTTNRGATASFHVKGKKEPPSGNVSDLEITFLGVAAPTRQPARGDYLAKDFGDKAVEDVQTAVDPLLNDKLGTISGVDHVPVEERGPVKFAIAQYFKSQSSADATQRRPGTRNAEVDVVVPIPRGGGMTTHRRVLYTFRFRNTRDVDVQRIGEEGVDPGVSASMTPRGSLARVNGFSAHLVGATEKDKVTAVTDWLQDRYPGVTPTTVATVAELGKDVSAQIRAGSKDPKWYDTNYGIKILTADEAKEWLDKKLGFHAPEDLQDLLDFRPDELFLLEYVLERMSDGIVSRFKGVRLLRQKVFFEFIRPRVFDRHERVAGATRGGPTNTTITMFDAATDNPGALFLGGIGPDGKPATMAASAMSFAHELGHVVATRDPTVKKAFDKMVSAKAIRPITWYAASDPLKELFPEAFALFYGDPEWLKNNWADLFDFFAALDKIAAPKKAVPPKPAGKKP
jgi:subtilisin family serine protease